MISLKCALAGSLLVASLGMAQAATITNGSFEDYPGAADPWSGIAAGNTDLTGWTIGGGGVDHIGNGWQSSLGSHNLDMSRGSAGSISQTITGLVSGQVYRITFDMAGNSAGGNVVKSLGLSLTGTGGKVFSFDTTGTSFSNMGWEGRHYDFLAAGPTADLTFTSLEANAFGAALDNVSISAVPLPAGVVLLGTGLGALALRRHRKG